jgi:hypothetical protein
MVRKSFRGNIKMYGVMVRKSLERQPLRRPQRRKGC